MPVIDLDLTSEVTIAINKYSLSSCLLRKGLVKDPNVKLIVLLTLRLLMSYIRSTYS